MLYFFASKEIVYCLNDLINENYIYFYKNHCEFQYKTSLNSFISTVQALNKYSTDEFSFRNLKSC